MRVHYSETNQLWYINCPVCKVTHAFGPAHGFDGNMEQPTIQGSLGWTGPVPDKGVMYCHSQITNGKIFFYEGEFANQTHELPEF